MEEVQRSPLPRSENIVAPCSSQCQEGGLESQLAAAHRPSLTSFWLVAGRGASLPSITGCRWRKEGWFAAETPAALSTWAFCSLIRRQGFTEEAFSLRFWAPVGDSCGYLYFGASPSYPAGISDTSSSNTSKKPNGCWLVSPLPKGL